MNTTPPDPMTAAGRSQPHGTPLWALFAAAHFERELAQAALERAQGDLDAAEAELERLREVGHGG